MPELPAPVEIVVNVRLSPEEWRLYRQGFHERGRELRAGDLQAYEDMLQLCSYFTLRRQDSCKASGPEAEVKHEFERREHEADVATRQLQAAKDALWSVKRMLQSEEQWLLVDQVVRGCVYALGKYEEVYGACGSESG